MKFNNRGTRNMLLQCRQRNYCCCGVIESRIGALIISMLWVPVFLVLALVSKSWLMLLLLTIPAGAIYGFAVERHLPYIPIIFLQMLITTIALSSFIVSFVTDMCFHRNLSVVEFNLATDAVMLPVIFVSAGVSLFNLWFTMTLIAAYRSIRDTRLIALEQYSKAPAMDDIEVAPIQCS